FNPAHSTAGSAATRVPTAVPAHGFTGFAGDVFSIAYPSSWTLSARRQSSSVGTLTLERFTGDSNLTLQVATVAPIPSDQLRAGLDPVAGVAVQGTILQVLGSTQTRAYNKVQWLANDYTQAVTTNTRQTTVQERVLAAKSGTRTYFVILEAPRDSFASVDAA